MIVPCNQQCQYWSGKNIHKKSKLILPSKSLLASLIIHPNWNELSTFFHLMSIDSVGFVFYHHYSRKKNLSEKTDTANLWRYLRSCNVKKLSNLSLASWFLYGSSQYLFFRATSERLTAFVHTEHWKVIMRLIECIDIKKCSDTKFTSYVFISVWIK